VTLDIVPSYQVRQFVFDHLPWDAAYEHFDEIQDAAYSVSLFTTWTDDVDQVWLKDVTPVVKFFTDAFNYSILWSTIWLGVKATLVCLLFGYPIAWIAARAKARWQSVLLFLVILPIMTSVVVRTFSWIVILGRQGVLNQIVMGLGLTDEPLRLLFTETGVIMVLAQVQMPLMVLPILTVMSKTDPNLADASRALGAGEWRTLWRVTLPLSLPGIIAGCILTYSACVTAFVTQTLIGGARLVYMPLHIYQQAVGANNWPFAAAISVVFMFAVLIVVYLLNQLTRLTPDAKS